MRLKYDDGYISRGRRRTCDADVVVEVPRVPGRAGLAIDVDCGLLPVVEPENLRPAGQHWHSWHVMNNFDMNFVMNKLNILRIRLL